MDIWFNCTKKKWLSPHSYHPSPVLFNMMWLVYQNTQMDGVFGYIEGFTYVFCTSGPLVLTRIWGINRIVSGLLCSRGRQESPWLPSPPDALKEDKRVVNSHQWSDMTEMEGSLGSVSLPPWDPLVLQKKSDLGSSNRQAIGVTGQNFMEWTEAQVHINSGLGETLKGVQCNHQASFWNPWQHSSQLPVLWPRTKNVTSPS